VVEVHKNVTILHCEIADFDEIVKSYQLGKELIELLEQLQSVLDMLCEQFSLLKVEQVAKQFTIVGGIKLSQLTDQTFFSVHHSVRVIDFAVALENYGKQKILKNGQHLHFRFGCDSG